jgi:hypothetical protein
MRAAQRKRVIAKRGVVDTRNELASFCLSMIDAGLKRGAYGRPTAVDQVVPSLHRMELELAQSIQIK